MWIWSKQINQLIFWIILIFIAFTITWGNAFITTACVILGLFWILEGNYKEKIQLLIQRKSPLFFIAIFIIILLGAIKQLPNPKSAFDIWHNLPLLIFVFTIGSKPQLTRSQFHIVLLVYILSIVANTLFSFTYFLHNSNSNTDIREVSLFMSYIRLTLYTLIGITACGYYIFYNAKVRVTRKEKFFLWFSLLWLIFFVLVLSSITGYIGLGILCLIFAISQIQKQKHPTLKFLPISLIIVFFWLIGDIVLQELHFFTKPDTITISKLDTHTLLGNPYTTFCNKSQLENGHWVNLYICQEELDEDWSDYSDIPLYGNDAKNHQLIYTLKRYMTSKNLRKDASGLKQLSSEDIKLIEAGCTNYRFANHLNLNHRTYEIFWEFDNYLRGRSPAGHSVTQRIEFLKCSYKVFKDNFWLGTGPANVMKALNTQYKNQSIQLPQQYWKKPHNQFMLFAVQYGIIGLSLFVLSLIGIIVFARKNLSVISIGWIFICGISFLNEDTLDGLNGLVFFAFFGSLFLFSQPFFREKNLAQQ